MQTLIPLDPTPSLMPFTEIAVRLHAKETARAVKRHRGTRPELLSKARIQQIHANALEKLRERIMRDAPDLIPGEHA